MRLFTVFLLAGLLILPIGATFASSTDSSSTRLLPPRLGNFRRVSITTDSTLNKPGLFGASPIAAERAEFAGSNAAFVVEILRFTHDAYAYEFLSLMASGVREGRAASEIRPDYGTAGYTTGNEVGFFKGPHFVSLTTSKGIEPSTLAALVSELGANLDNGEGDIPVLVKHLPNPEEGQKNAVFLHSFHDLGMLGFDSGVFSAIDSGGNADAVLATYGPSKVLIIEFNTPQLAADNDRRIISRIRELWELGQAAPTAYRRVGNYSVFVFDAPDEQSAKQLIDQVKYEQVVQWLGDNPNLYKEAERRYYMTTLGVLISVMKASGGALITCLGLGGLFGALLFNYRRSQQKRVTAFSDAGGMLRLNLDELTPKADPSRLLRERN